VGQVGYWEMESKDAEIEGGWSDDLRGMPSSISRYSVLCRRPVDWEWQERSDEAEIGVQDVELE